MKTRPEIELDLIADTVANMSPDEAAVADFNVGTTIRAMLTATSGGMFDSNVDIAKFKRGAFLSDLKGNDLAEGTQLDQIGNDRGIPRKGPGGSTTYVVISGNAGTLVPASTVVKTGDGTVRFQTLYDLTLGRNEVAGTDGYMKELSLIDAVEVESLSTGSITNVAASTITALETAITGVTSLTNPLAAEGGFDSEPDPVYRERIREYGNTLSQDTQAFFEATAREEEPTVLKAIAVYAGYDSVTVYVLKNSGAQYDQATLDAIATAISNAMRSFTTVAVQNMTMVPATVVTSVKLKPGYTLAQVFASIANNLAGFLNWQTWSFGTTVAFSDIVDKVLDSEGVGYADITKLTLNGSSIDLPVGPTSLPRLIDLEVTDIDTGESVQAALSQQYLGT